MDSPRIPTSLRMCGPLALALLAALPLVPIATRFGLLRWQIGLPLTALAVLGSAILLCVLLFLFFRAPLRAFRPLTAAIAGVALAPVMAGALVVLPAGELPVIHDISTDLADPPHRGSECGRFYSASGGSAWQRSDGGREDLSGSESNGLGCITDLAIDEPPRGLSFRGPHCWKARYVTQSV